MGIPKIDEMREISQRVRNQEKTINLKKAIDCIGTLIHNTACAGHSGILISRSPYYLEFFKDYPFVEWNDVVKELKKAGYRIEDYEDDTYIEW